MYVAYTLYLSLQRKFYPKRDFKICAKLFLSNLEYFILDVFLCCTFDINEVNMCTCIVARNCLEKRIQLVMTLLITKLGLTIIVKSIFYIYIYIKDECPVDALRACVFIYLPYILKNNGEFRRK